MIVRKYKNSIGFTLWSFNHKRVELWYFPSRFYFEHRKHIIHNTKLIYLGLSKLHFFRKMSNTDIDEFTYKFPSNFFSFIYLFPGNSYWFYVANFLPCIILTYTPLLISKTSKSIIDDIKEET